jgi:hypothetical protein
MIGSTKSRNRVPGICFRPCTSTAHLSESYMDLRLEVDYLEHVDLLSNIPS